MVRPFKLLFFVVLRQQKPCEVALRNISFDSMCFIVECLMFFWIGIE